MCVCVCVCLAWRLPLATGLCLPLSLSVPVAASAMGVQRLFSAVRLPTLPRLALPQPSPHVLPRVLGPVASSRTYSSGIVKSPFNDIEIPEISICQYVFDAQEPYADKPAMVSVVHVLVMVTALLCIVFQAEHAVTQH